MDLSGFQPIHVLGGQCTVSAEPDTMLITVLGSCVSACVYDPVAGVGGMNHFILPTGGRDEPDKRRQRYGDVAMRSLVDELCRHGARPERLVAKLYGGRCRKAGGGAGDPGSLNAAFAKSFLKGEGIQVVDASLGDDVARWVTFHPSSGWVQIKERADAASVASKPKRTPIR